MVSPVVGEGDLTDQALLRTGDPSLLHDCLQFLERGELLAEGDALDVAVLESLDRPTLAGGIGLQFSQKVGPAPELLHGVAELVVEPNLHRNGAVG